jgi:hypothetical protein
MRKAVPALDCGLWRQTQRQFLKKSLPIWV